MKILHVCETIKGGVGTYLNTFEAVCGDVVENHFVVPEDHRSMLGEEVSVTTFRRKSRGMAGLVALVRAASRQARQFQPDIMFFHSTISLGAMAAMRRGWGNATFVYCPHAWARLRYENKLKGRLVSALEGRLCGLSDLILNIAHNDRALARQFGYAGHHIVVENALPDLLEIPQANPFEAVSDRINLLFVGRFDRQKGLDILLEAFPKARLHNPSLHLHIVGASVEDGAVGSVEQTEGVTFYDWVPPDQISAYYQFADLVVMPSRWEGLPMVLIEATRAGTPVILTDRSGMANLIEDGLSGWVVPPNAQAFEDAMAKLTSESLRKMRPAARKLYEMRYSSTRFRKETLAALEEALAAKAPRGQITPAG